MSIANIFNTPKTADEMAQWSFLHMALHRSQNLGIYRRFSVILPESVLDPMDPAPYGVWFLDHQVAHNNMDAVLNVARFDLLDVDWENEAARIGWLQSHAQLHRQEGNILGVFA